MRKDLKYFVNVFLSVSGFLMLFGDYHPWGKDGDKMLFLVALINNNIL